MFVERQHDSLEEVLDWLQTQAPSEWAELLFIPEQNYLLTRSLSALRSPLTLSVDCYERWLSEGGILLARTIDGDYIGEKHQQTYFLPRSLVLDDIRVYPRPFIQLLCAYELSEAPIESFFL
ncbi:hypothetical protein BAU15_13155 [Enterococcus sp. JM4C]|uniref:hypothetical protein n=1 Tax=Candidatus Enterococcus huntleyi TaxID=1857217 RepID=UPI0013794667|nr:hypothetical protein [Enterococcus sp. JM4C]KAF1297710.1 hypothetical protein BAU15_13155 [Enterococcus sp. JM4C]